MSFKNKIKNYIFGIVSAKKIRNSYMGAQVTRLAADQPTARYSLDYDLRTTLSILVARSRHLYQNNDYARKFIKMTGTNVIGPDGIALQNKAKLGDVFDSKANTHIEEKWKAWGMKGVCDVTGKLSWYEAGLLYIQTMARDGEVLIREVKGFDNEFGYALQFIDTDLLDINLNRIEANGNLIKMGVELDAWNKPVAYWLLQRHPGDYINRPNAKTWSRIPAEEIIHDFIPERSNQTRGVPWMHSSIIRLAMLGGFEEAELVASRVAASKMGIITSKTGEEFVGDDKDEKENPIIDADPGTFPVLPEGFEMTMFDPKHPNSNVQEFRKAMLQGIASGLLVSYTSLASDLESVNYSSIRAGVLEERDNWRMLQSHVIGNLCERVFRSWLGMGLLTSAVKYPPSYFDRLNKPTWQPRTWPWVDPLKDVRAHVEALASGITTRTALAAQEGADFEEDILRVMQEEKKLMEKYGIRFEPVKNSKDADIEEEPIMPGKKGNGKNGGHRE